MLGIDLMQKMTQRARDAKFTSSTLCNWTIFDLPVVEEEAKVREISHWRNSLSRIATIPQRDVYN